MTIDQVREIWRLRAEAKTKAIMDAYRARRNESGGGYGHEGLGVYGIYQERAAREKVRLAVRLLEKAGLEVSYNTIRTVTGQSPGTISGYWTPLKTVVQEDLPTETSDDQLRILRFLDGSRSG